MDLSVVVPVLNEAENIPGLVGEIRAALDGKLDYEIVYVDDGSTDDSVAVLRRLAAASPMLRLVRHGARSGQSAAIRTGVKAARGPWIATLDGDGQNDPADIPLLWAARDATGADALLLVAGQRQKRSTSRYQ
jgi:dolichol-phosphate mannosyltransferase